VNEAEYLIVGAGPTGLGAASRAAERGADWRLLEAGDHFGGLAATFVDQRGFTWDQGGHVQFSHYETFDRYMDAALGTDGWLTHQRESWCWVRRRWVPYPFQNNLHRLDPADRWACVQGLLEAWEKTVSGVGCRVPGEPETRNARPETFRDWMLATFGPGVTEIFMRPYNFKVWAYPPETMDYGWIGERVAVPKLEGVLKSLCTGEDAVSWGPNALFRFPKRGGTGAVWDAIGRMLPAGRVHLGDPVEQVDVAARTVTTRSGVAYRYRRLISTLPLNQLIRLAPGVVSASAGNGLIFSSTHVVGIGLEGQPPEHLRTKCWMYFPEANSPYYRVTVFSNYSPHNVPRPGQQWSLMTETAQSPAKPVDAEQLVAWTERALVEDGLIPDPAAICSRAHYCLAQGYPTPFRGRDAVVDPLLRAFEAHGIFSRGRFGAWKYEVANQDHSFAQGYECVDRLLAGGGPEFEPTLHTPGLVNGRRNA
jgi:protoporphyrinogen oxidase